MSWELFLAGLIASHTLLFICFKVGIRKVLGYDAAVDVLATVLLLWMFDGTYSGMIAASIGGLVITGELWLLKKYLGYEKLIYRNNRLEWIAYAPLKRSTR